MDLKGQRPKQLTVLCAAQGNTKESSICCFAEKTLNVDWLQSKQKRPPFLPLVIGAPVPVRPSYHEQKECCAAEEPGSGGDFLSGGEDRVFQGRKACL